MTINKFQGRTKEEAIEKAKEVFGQGAVIMNVKEIKPRGLFRSFKSSTYEVTAAMEERENFSSAAANTGNSGVALPPRRDNINLMADEKIPIPQPVRTESLLQPSEDMRKERDVLPRYSEKEDKKLEERLDNLSNMLEKKLGVAKEAVEPMPVLTKSQSVAELKVGRILYTTLLNNEVSELYVNQLLDEIEKFLRPGNSVDTILSNIYQKLILRFGQPKTIDLSANANPRVVFFIGPTGVGKTTTIAKLASKYKVENDKKVAFITADTYRIAATEQLKVYANILDAPMSVIYSAEEMNTALVGLTGYDLVFVDTAGFSHRNMEQRKEIKKLIEGLDAEYPREIYLVLSATTKYKDLMEIVDVYKEISSFKLLITKLDETTTYGNILNIKLYSEADLSYVTNGQNVPDDIEIFDTQKIVKQLLGGH